METNYITLTKENIADEHICCAFSDKKCKDSLIMVMFSDVLTNGRKCSSNMVLLKRRGFLSVLLII